MCFATTNIPLDQPGRKSVLEHKFQDSIDDRSLKHLLPVIQGLMRFNPEERISAEEALKMVNTIHAAP
jgi:serine/threonine-protein kinase SRPK3